MYAAERAEHALGNVLAEGLCEAIADEDASILRAATRAAGPRGTLEIGLGEGASTLAILSETLANGGKTRPHVCIEEAIGLLGGRARLEDADVWKYVELHEESSHLALPRLLREERRFGLALIDGRHLFDYALVDAFHCDLLLVDDGLLVLDDVNWPAIAAVQRFLETNRGYVRTAGSDRLCVLQKSGEDRRLQPGDTFYDRFWPF